MEIKVVHAAVRYEIEGVIYSAEFMKLERGGFEISVFPVPFIEGFPALQFFFNDEALPNYSDLAYYVDLSHNSLKKRHGKKV